MTDDRPWLVFKSPKRGIRVKKRDVLAIGQGRADEEKVGELPAGLSSHDAVTLARQKFGKLATKVEAATWFGYWSKYDGARCRKVQIPAMELRPGEKLIGTFPSDMEEEDVIGMIKAKYQPKSKPVKFFPHRIRGRR